jgi:uncharacterized protein YecT (DUF1311 family)
MTAVHRRHPFTLSPISLRSWLALTVLLSAAMAGHTQPATPALDAPPTASCRPDGTPEQVNACAYDGYERAQKQLDERLPAWLRQQPAQRRSALQAEQQAWAKKRDAECRDLALDAAGPQAAAGEYQGCRKQRTLERLAALR